MINYYAVEEALRTKLEAAAALQYVFGVNRLLDIPRLFERLNPSPMAADLLAAPTTQHGIAVIYFSGLDSVEPGERSDSCERSSQEWHIFVFTRTHRDDTERREGRKVNGILTAKVIDTLRDYDWLAGYYQSLGQSGFPGSSKLRRVTADKLLVAEERAIEDPTIVGTLLAYRAMLSSNWK